VAASVSGAGECRTTGQVTAAAVRRLLTGSVPAGVHDLDAVVDVAAFLAGLGDDLQVRLPAPTPVRSPASVDWAVQPPLTGGRTATSSPSSSAVASPAAGSSPLTQTRDASRTAPNSPP
jgi:hypothetical protein